MGPGPTVGGSAPWFQHSGYRGRAKGWVEAPGSVRLESSSCLVGRPAGQWPPGWKRDLDPRTGGHEETWWCWAAGGGGVLTLLAEPSSLDAPICGTTVFARLPHTLPEYVGLCPLRAPSHAGGGVSVTELCPRIPWGLLPRGDVRRRLGVALALRSPTGGRPGWQGWALPPALAPHCSPGGLAPQGFLAAFLCAREFHYKELD